MVQPEKSKATNLWRTRCPQGSGAKLWLIPSLTSLSIRIAQHHQLLVGKILECVSTPQGAK